MSLLIRARMNLIGVKVNPDENGPFYLLLSGPVVGLEIGVINNAKKVVLLLI